MLQNNIGTFVIYAPMCGADVSLPLYPKERYLEIAGCKNDRVKMEKYLVWKLLEKVVRDILKLNFDNLQFTKTENGKWLCPDFYFSLSHTDDLVCVAVSDSPVGVDVQIVHPIRTEIMHRILAPEERCDFDALPEDEKSTFLLEAWCKKESIFKKRGGQALMPMLIDSSRHDVTLKYVQLTGKRYRHLIAVCCDSANNIEFKFMEEI